MNIWKSIETTTIKHCGHIGYNDPSCTCKEETEVNYTSLSLEEVKDDLEEIELSQLYICKDNSISLTLESEIDNTLIYSEVEYKMTDEQLIELLDWMKS